MLQNSVDYSDSKMTPINTAKQSCFWEANILSNDQEICLLWKLQVRDFIHKNLYLWI